MRFGVLGSLLVVDGAGRDVSVQSAKQRSLLAVLLCDSSHVVSVDRLLDVLWEGRPPATARRGLPVYIHRLRAVLGESRIRHGASGYELVVEPDEVDAVRFETLAAEGRRALDSGDPESASARLTEALELWRGEAYAGLEDVEVLHVEAERLNELRTVVLECKADADLALGRHGELVSELTALVAEHPLRERFRAQLMLALYRSGRAPEALEVYRETRTLLIDELGLEPGAELRHLERAILEQDPELQLPTEQPAAGLGRVDGADPRPQVLTPAELPPANPTFTGRHEEIGALTESLTESLTGGRTGSPVVTFNGPGGIGKSTLAIQAANVVSSAFPDGQLYVNLHGTVLGAEAPTPRVVLARFLRSLGLLDNQIPDDVDEAAAKYRSITAEMRLLVVLDDAVDVSQVRPLIPGGSGCAVMVTSRTVLSALDGAVHVRVGALSDDEAVVLLARLAGTDRVASDSAAAAEVARLCDRVPLAVRIAGARLAARPDWTMASFARRLRDAHGRLDELEHGDLAVRASCAVGLQGLQESAVRLLLLLSLPGLHDFSLTAAAALDGRDRAPVERDIDRLIDAQLLEPITHERVAVHDLVRLYARERAEEEFTAAERLAAKTRLVHSYISNARNISRRFGARLVERLTVGIGDDALVRTEPDFDTPDAGAAWIRAEAKNLEAVARVAELLEDEGASLAGFATSLYVPIYSQGYWRELYDVDTIAMHCVEEGEVNPKIAPRLWRDLANACRELGRDEESRELLEKTLAYWREHGDRWREGSALLDVGRLQSNLHEYAAAVETYRQCVALFREIGARDQEALALNNLGGAVNSLGRLDEGLGLLREALAIQEVQGQSKSLGVVHGNIGELLVAFGDREAAISHFEQAVESFRLTGHSQLQAHRLWDLGEELYRLGRHDEARERWRQALDLGVAMNVICRDEADRVLADQVPAKPEAITYTS